MKENDQQRNANLYITEGAEKKKILDRVFKIIIQENFLEIREKLNLRKGLMHYVWKIGTEPTSSYIYVYLSLIKLLYY